MRMRRETLKLRAALMALALVIGLASVMPGRFGAVTSASVRTPSPSSPRAATTECEGEACGQITFTFDEAKQQYLAHNNSTDRWVKVSASNLSSFASACVGPGKDGELALKSVVGPYHAEYNDGCGTRALGD